MVICLTKLSVRFKLLHKIDPKNESVTETKPECLKATELGLVEVFPCYNRYIKDVFVEKF